MLVFSRDPEKGPRAMDPSGESLFASFLMDDLQSVRICAHIRQQTDRVRQGTLESWETEFNAHSLTLEKDKARVEHLFLDTQPESMLLEEFSEVIERWTEVLTP